MDNDPVLRDKLVQFIQLASKTGGMQYYTPADVQYLHGLGKTLGLPSSLIEGVISTKAVNNGKVLKEIAEKVKDLREYKHVVQFMEQKIREHFPAQNQASTNDIKDNKHQIISNDHPTTAQNYISDINNNAGFMVHQHRQHQADLQKLTYEVHDLNNVTGGDSEHLLNNQHKKKKDTDKDIKMDTYTTKIPLKPLTKKFTMDR